MPRGQHESEKETKSFAQENGKRRPKNQPKNIQSRVMMSHTPKNKKIAMPSDAL